MISADASLLMPFLCFVSFHYAFGKTNFTILVIRQLTTLEANLFVQLSVILWLSLSERSITTRRGAKIGSL